jgi:putative endonuclease
VTSPWYVYILHCVDGSLYTGITTDVARRVAEHNGDVGGGSGARYTRTRRPVRLVFQEAVCSRSAAGRREHEIKCLSRAQKACLIRQSGVGG